MFLLVAKGEVVGVCKYDVYSLIIPRTLCTASSYEAVPHDATAADIKSHRPAHVPHIFVCFDY